MNPAITIKNILSQSSDRLKKQNIHSYRLDAEILISHILKTDRIKLFADFDKPINNDESNRIKKAVLRRMEYEPIAYIIGYKEFFSLKYIVNKNVLIPRPETELLVEEVLNCSPCEKKILDIGTGSGNIGITIKKNVHSSVVACSDISLSALKIAAWNRSRLLPDDHIEFIQSDIYYNINEKYDIIVSNPPYILSREIDLLQDDVKNYEPLTALNGNNDGLYFYSRIISDIKKYLNPGGYLFLEINPILKEPVLNLLDNAGLFLTKVRKDHNDHDRVVTAKNEN